MKTEETLIVKDENGQSKVKITADEIILSVDKY